MAPSDNTRASYDPNFPNVTYFGILRACTSWGKVGRHMASALLDIGCDINVFERKGFLYREDFKLPERLTARVTNSFRDDAVFTFEHPNVYDYLKGRLKIGLLTYETTVVPSRWVECVNQHLDVLLMPSTFCFEIFEKAGVPKERMVIQPYGFDPDVYYPKDSSDARAASDEEFRFLTVTSPHKREGVENVLSAYRAAFSSADDVSLTIKANYLPGAKTKPFEYAAFAQMIQDFASDPKSPKIRLISEYLAARQLADLYRASSCLVSATRGEGFGMVFLEAAASGVPIIVTGWSGHMDFVGNANARTVKFRLRPAKEMQYDCQSDESLLAEADVNDLARHMRESFDERTCEKPPFSRDWLKRYSWSFLAQEFVGILEERMT
jgi:glycosyltransferase involved in cell wall biosynthesis